MALTSLVLLRRGRAQYGGRALIRVQTTLVVLGTLTAIWTVVAIWGISEIGLDWPMQVSVWIMLGLTPALAAKAGWGRLMVKRRQVRSQDYLTFVEPTNEAAEEEIIEWEQNRRAKGHRADQYISVKCAECRSTVRFVSKRRTALCRNCGARLALRRI